MQIFLPDFCIDLSAELTAMLSRLQKKWKVGSWQLLVILLTFAIAGTLTGYVGRLLMKPLAAKISTGLFLLIYIIVVALLWPFFVLLISLATGQFTFFRSYLLRMAHKIARTESGTDAGMVGYELSRPVRIAIFASGNGSNARKIIDHFTSHSYIKVVLVVVNKATAGVCDVARTAGIPVLMIDRERFFRGDDGYIDELEKAKIDFIVLAGFLWKIPLTLIKKYHRAIVNIHPALLPKHGGKGLYGRHVHEAVIKSGDKESGITIHYVDEIYDHGDPIFQEKLIVEPTDTPDTLAKKIQVLEHLHFASVIERVIVQKFGRRV